MRVIVSGATYYACLDPYGTEFYREQPEIPQPRLIAWGKGKRADFGDLSLASVGHLLDHLDGYATTFSGGGSDAETAAEGRAIRKDWVRLRKVFEAVEEAPAPAESAPVFDFHKSMTGLLGKAAQ